MLYHDPKQNKRHQGTLASVGVAASLSTMVGVNEHQPHYSEELNLGIQGPGF